MGDSMSSVVISGDTSGAITLSAPAVAGTNTITLPANAGTIVTTASSAVVTQAMLGTNVAGNGPAFSAYYSGNTTTASSSTWTKITFDTEDFDTNSNFASNRFTPTVAGYYQINIVASCAQNGSTTAQVNIAIYKNGTIYKSLQSVSPGGQYIGVTNTAVVYFNGSTDYVEGYIWGSAAMNYYGAANTGSGGAGANNTYISGCLLRAA
jgi:hypothetical protein